MADDSAKSERLARTRTGVRILEPGIGTRINEAASAIGSRAKAAQIAGISDDMLYRYMREESPPRFDVIAALAHASGYSLDWMATGHEQGAATQGKSEARRETLERAQKSAPQLFRRRDEAAVIAQAAGEDAWFDERLEEIERMLEQEPDTPVPTARLEADERLSQALTDVRRIAQNPEAPAKQRTRAATIGELAFGDEDLGRLREELARPTAQQKMQRFQRVSDDLASAVAELGYDPPPMIREALKTAMYHHGLTRDGAAVLLQFISAELEQHRKGE